MKTLNIQITLFSLMSILFLTPLKAQEKTEGPSLEETVAYINKTLSSSVGIYSKDEDSKDEITMQQFSLASYNYESKFSYGEYYSCTSMYKSQFTNISWETLTKFEEEGSESLIKLEIHFEHPLQWAYNRIVKCDGREKYNERSGSQKVLAVYLLPDKVENIKKAFLHLKKLMYVEDPFGD